MKLWMSRRYMQNLVWSKRESRIQRGIEILPSIQSGGPDRKEQENPLSFKDCQAPASF